MFHFGRGSAELSLSCGPSVKIASRFTNVEIGA